MNKRFEFGMTILLSIVTCGIYAIYMLYTMTETNNELARRNNVPTISGFIVAILLGCVTCGIYTIYWIYKFMEQQIRLAQSVGVAPAPADNAIILLICYCIPIYNYYVLCDNYNRTLDGAGI